MVYKKNFKEVITAHLEVACRFTFNLQDRANEMMRLNPVYHVE